MPMTKKKTQTILQATLLKQIQNGKFKDFYIIYNRKSTDEPDNQKNSIAYQKRENTRFAKQHGLPIATLSIKGFCSEGIVSERHSGFKESNEVYFTEEGLVQYKIERPKFQKLLEYASKGYFKGVVVLSWDRISRNKGDDAVIRKLMRKGIDIKFAFASYDNTSSGALHMDIDGMFSAHHSRVTSEKVTLATKNLRGRGICTYRAPIGYLNLGDMNDKPQDPERAPYIKELFKKYATGRYTLNDLVRYSAEVGLRSTPMRRRRTQEELLLEENEMQEISKVTRPLTNNRISRILKNTFYIGKIKDVNGQLIDSVSHKPLIDNNTFIKVQHQLAKRQTSTHYDKKIYYPFRGMIRCGECNRVYTPYLKKGIIYYSSRCVKTCDNTLKSFNSSFINRQNIEKLKQLVFTEEEYIRFQTYAETDIALLEEKRNKNLEQIEQKKKRIRKSLAYLHSNKLSLLESGMYTIESFVDEQTKLNNALEALLDQEHVSELAMRDLMRDVIKLSELFKDLIEYYNFGKPEEKEELIRILFSELTISDKTLNYKLNTGLKPLESHFYAVCDPTAQLFELLPYKQNILDSINTLKLILGK